MLFSMIFKHRKHSLHSTGATNEVESHFKLIFSVLPILPFGWLGLVETHHVLAPWVRQGHEQICLELPKEPRCLEKALWDRIPGTVGTNWRTSSAPWHWHSRRNSDLGVGWGWGGLLIEALPQPGHLPGHPPNSNRLTLSLIRSDTWTILRKREAAVWVIPGYCLATNSVRRKRSLKLISMPMESQRSK